MISGSELVRVEVPNGPPPAVSARDGVIPSDVALRILSAVVKGLIDEGTSFAATREGKKVLAALDGSDALRNLDVVWSFLGLGELVRDELPGLNLRGLLGNLRPNDPLRRFEDELMRLMDLALHE